MSRFERRDLALTLAGALVFLGCALVAVFVVREFAVALVGAGVVFALGLMTVVILRQIQARVDESRSLTEASMALYYALKPVAPLPPMSGYALTPDAGLVLYNMVLRQRPNVVVEMGSGVSSLIIGYALKAQGGGHLYSLELNEDYARKSRAELERHGLGDQVTVLAAPLREINVDGAPHRWHDPAPLAAVDAIDLVFDDGPPRSLGPNLRDAALPLIMPKLSRDAVYLMNFVTADERRTVGAWLRRFPELEAEWLATKKGNVILRRRRARHDATEPATPLARAAAAR